MFDGDLTIRNATIVSSIVAQRRDWPAGALSGRLICDPHRDPA